MENTGAMLLIVAILLLGGVFWYKRKSHGETATGYAKQIEDYVPVNTDAMEVNTLAYYQVSMRNIAKQLYNTSQFKQDAVNLWKTAEEAERPLMIMIMGEFKTGKSTFINTLLGEDVMATDAAPATAVVSLLRYGSEREVKLYLQDGSVKPYDFTSLAEITAEGDASKQALRDSIAYVEICLPNELLKRVNLIDTPGLNVHNDRHIKQTESLMHTADIVFWVFNAARSATRTELAEIEKLGQRLKPFAIVNRIDNIDEEEESIEEVLATFSRRIGKNVKLVVGISAKMAKEAMAKDDVELLANSGWKHFQETMDSYFVAESDRLKLKSVREKLAEMLQALQQSIVQADTEQESKAKLFVNRDEALATLTKNCEIVTKTIDESIRQREAMQNQQQIFNEYYAKADSSMLDEREELIDYMVGLLNQIDNYMPYTDMFTSFESLNPILGKFQLLYDDIEQEVDKLRRWRDAYAEIDDTVEYINREANRIEGLQKEYEHSGFFGGEPIFDFSGRRERLNKAIDRYNKRREKFCNELELHWNTYCDLCRGAISINNSLSQVAQEFECSLTKCQKEMLKEKVELETNYEAEKARYKNAAQELTCVKSYAVELENILAKI